MLLYDVEFSLDGKIFDNFIGDYVKAWNAEEAKDYALTWYTENGGKEEDRRYTGVITWRREWHNGSHLLLHEWWNKRTLIKWNVGK